MRARFLAVPCLTLLALAGCNQAPEGLGITLTPEAPSTLDDLVVTLSPGATDPNAKDAVTHRYAWFVDDSRMDDLNTESVTSGDTRKGQVWRVSVTPYDGKLSGTAVEAEVTIVNTPPTVEASVSPDDPATEDRVRATANGSDIDGDQVSLRYQWSLNGSVTSLTNDTLPATRTNKGELWELQVFPNDGDVDGEPAVLEFTIANTPPSVAKATVEPAAPTKSSTMTCRAQGWLDVDEDEADYKVKWLVNGVEVSPDVELQGSEVNRGDNVACELTPWDGDDEGEPVLSGSVIVRNTPPTISSVVIGPEDPLANDNVSATLSDAIDLDGDEVSYNYSWRINGREVGTGKLLPGSRFVKDDQILLQVTPDDGYGDGVAVISNKIIAGNNPPSIVGLTLPDDLYTDTSFQIEAHTSDHDGDDIELFVEWYVNKSKVTETSDTLEGKVWFDKGDEVYGIVTPDDGDDEGPAETTKVFTVLNSPPSLAGISIDPSQPKTADDLLCQVDKDSVDPDDDKFTYSLYWEKDGKRWTGKTETTTITGDTIPASETDDSGEEWTCHVLASDGDDTSDSWVKVNVGGFVSGFKGEVGPSIPGYLQCEGYLDKSGGDEVPKAWGDSCTDTKYNKMVLACGATKSKFRYIEVSKNVFKDKLKSYPERGLITSMKDEAHKAVSFTGNDIYATGNDPHTAQSWWVNGNGCNEASVSITVNNSCTYEASNCFGQGLTSDRYLWVYVKP